MRDEPKLTPETVKITGFFHAPKTTATSTKTIQEVTKQNEATSQPQQLNECTVEVASDVPEGDTLQSGMTRQKSRFYRFHL